MTRTSLPLAFAAVAFGACYVGPPPSYQTAPPPQYQPSPPPETVAPPPPQASYVPPPAPVYTPPEANPVYVNLDEVPPAESAPSVDVFYDALAPYGRWEVDVTYDRVWIPANPAYQPYHDG